MRRALKNRKLLLSIIILLPVLFATFFGPLLIKHNPLEIHSTSVLAGSSSEFPLGTDEYGRDIYSRLIVGIRPTMIVGIFATLLSCLLGTTIGLFAGYYRGWTEKLFMRSLDILLSFPPVLLALLVVGLWGSGTRNLILIIGIVYAPYFARIVHSATIQVKGQEFVQSEMTLGASSRRILFKSIFPNILSSLIVQISLTFASAILLESGLSFLGLGITPPDPSWGQMIGSARAYIYNSPTYIIWPSVLLAVTMLGINTLGDCLRDLLDPKTMR